MAVDMFMKFDGIDGESIDETHAGEVDILAWSWGMSQSGTMHMGTGGGAGRANINDLSFTHYIDKASPNLMMFCCNGKHMSEVVLTVRKAGETPVEYLVVTLKKVIVTSVSVGGSSGEDRLTENVTLNFEEFKVTHTEQADDGSSAGQIETAWNIATNAAV